MTTASIFVSIAPEWASAREQLDGAYAVREHVAHREYLFDDELVLEREPTGLRHALWYSVLAGVHGGDVVQFDKTHLRVVADADAV